MQAIETARLQLHPLDGRHEQLYCSIYTDPALMRHVAAPLSESEAAGSFALACRQSASTFPAWWWAIHTKTAGEVVGVAGLTGGEPGSTEIGVMLLVEAQGRGIASEAFSALLDVAFSSLRMTVVRARHLPGNAAMAAVLRKLGFRLEDPLADSLGNRSPGWQVWRIEAPAAANPQG
jgi:[ribosomal protein S5]-alanine N-acetyltransferase